MIYFITDDSTLRLITTKTQGDNTTKDGLVSIHRGTGFQKFYYYFFIESLFIFMSAWLDFGLVNKNRDTT